MIEPDEARSENSVIGMAQTRLQNVHMPHLFGEVALRRRLRIVVRNIYIKIILLPLVCSIFRCLNFKLYLLLFEEGFCVDIADV